MKEKIQALLKAVLPRLLDAVPEHIQVERTKQKAHGDFATNVALVCGKKAGMAPRVFAEQLMALIDAPEWLVKMEIAGPGFINFFVAEQTQLAVVEQVLASGTQFGCGAEKSTKIHLEYVSANPTGPLHVGHGRGAAYGSALANLLTAAGYPIHREYYVNDAGRQMDILAVSVWLRYLECHGAQVAFPSNGYKGEYIKEIASQLAARDSDLLVHDPDAVFAGVPQDETKAGQGDKEAHVDGLIVNAKNLLGEHYATVHGFALLSVLEDIQADLAEFHVTFDEWFSEKRLVDEASVQAALDKLQAGGWLYQKAGATWFKSTEFGDDKDRVLVRENGQTTYFASDAAYMINKIQRGYDELVYVLGADHHGYVPRLRALMQAFGYAPERLKVPLVQFAVLYRSGKQVQMSTRSGSFVTLRELREEVGTDAARFFYVMRKCEQHLDFDLDLAKSQSNDNPVYYLQYAHARICSVFRQLAEKGWTFDQAAGLAYLSELEDTQLPDIATALATFPELIQSAASKHEPHLLAYYLKDLAQRLHAYYNAHPFLVDDAAIRNARLCVIAAIQHVLRNGLNILGVSAPEHM